jgi:iron complex outermembrane receptor protein
MSREIHDYPIFRLHKIKTIYMKKVILLSLAMMFFGYLAFAQQVVSGKITDNTGNPVQGASIRIKGTTKGVTSSGDGSYKLSANTIRGLEITMIGYAPQTIDVNGRSEINVVLVPQVSELGQIVFVATRRAGRIKTETPVPVDVVNVAQATLPSGRMDITSVLNYAVPSFNYNKQSGSDGADHVDLATLRGLGPDQTLVLVNGKRRHQTSFVAVFGTRGRGNSGTDLN